MSTKKNQGKFKEEIAVFPVGESTNESIAKHPSMMQREMEWDNECYFGKARQFLPLYTGISKLVFNSLKNSNLSFYAFIKKTKDGHWQYFYSQEISKTPDESITQEVADLLAKVKQLQATVA